MLQSLTMSKKKECTICKHYGKAGAADQYLERTQVYDETGAPVGIYLCKSHSVELFKMGQRKFLLSHYRILVDLVDSDEPKFLEVLEKTVKRFPGEIGK
jgi:hypothetical protein